MTSKERAFLRREAHALGPVVQIGKEMLTPEVVAAIEEALDARELIKVGVLKNCFDDPRALGEMAAARTHSQVVQVMGRKITLYKRKKKDSRYSIL